jgi:aspartate/methionine/tyrosine aminotransferase
MEINPQAKELNDSIIKSNKVVFNLLSEKGKAIFFPKKGILSQSADAKGKKINATIGIALEEDKSPMRIDSVNKNITLEPENVFPYAPSFGNPNIREKWKEKIFEKNKALKGKDISLPVVTNALTHGLSIAGYLFVDPDDEIISPDLFWGNYKLIFVNGYDTKIKTFETFKDEKFNISGLKEALKEGSKKKILLLNFPNNPSGYTPTEEEAMQIISSIKEAAEAGKNILVLVDDAYFGLVYENGIFEESIFGHLADIHENVLAVKIDGATKEDYVWGLRVGFLTYSIKNGNKDIYGPLEAKTAGAIRGNVSNVPNLSQSILLEAYKDADYKEQKKEKFMLLKKRYTKLKETLKENSKYEEYFKALPFNSGYFMCIKLKAGMDSEALRQKLLSEYDTGVIVFDDLVRIAFSSVTMENIPDLFENIYDACKKLEEN